MTTYFSCAPIPFNNAKKYVRCGGNVFASCQASARKLAYAIGNGNVPVGPEKHGGLPKISQYRAG